MDYDDNALMIQKDGEEVNRRYKPNGDIEGLFRQQVRDVLNLDWSARDHAIIAEIRRLKKIEEETRGICEAR